MGAISWEQTLVSAALSAVAAWLAYRGAGVVLRRQQALSDLRTRRDALQQVLVQLDDSVLEYLESGNDDDYPQREMVELERCALQAQVHYLRDLTMQKALRDICYPNRYKRAMETIRAGITSIEADIAAAGGEGR